MEASTSSQIIRPSRLMYVPVFGVILEAKERGELGPKIKALFEQVKKMDAELLNSLKIGSSLHKQPFFIALNSPTANSLKNSFEKQDELRKLLDYGCQLDDINGNRRAITILTCFLCSFFGIVCFLATPIAIAAIATSIVAANLIASWVVSHICSDVQEIRLLLDKHLINQLEPEL